MFRENTVFITGAGASWHYGYPTGDKLIKDMVEAALLLERFHNYIQKNAAYNIPRYYRDRLSLEGDTNISDKAEAAASECRRFYAMVNVQKPLIIDYFLGQNPSLAHIGKFLIAWVILKCEPLEEKNLNRSDALQGKHNDDWIPSILHTLTTDCEESKDLVKNTVKFITFNYDTSFERAVRRALVSNERFGTGYVEDFMADDRFLHVYGSIGDFTQSERHERPNIALFREKPDNQAELAASVALIDQVDEISKALQVIDPIHKKYDQAAIKIAQQDIKNARHLYILGFGFDKVNSALLGLDNIAKHGISLRKIYVTNFMDLNSVNSRLAKIICNDDPSVLRAGIDVYRGPGSGLYVEKSSKDTYGALWADFDLQQ